MATEQLRRLQRLLGLYPLALFALWHLWEHSPIRAGRSEVLERLYGRFESLPVWLEGGLLLGALALSASLGALLYVRQLREASHAARERLRNVGLAELLALAFVAWHLLTLWVPARAGEGGALRAMALAEAQLDSFVGALAFVVGWSAFVVRLGYALVGERPATSAENPALGRAALAFGASLLLWLWGVDLLTAYVAGASLF